MSANGPRSIGALIGGALDPIAKKRGFSTVEILLRWEAVAGSALAAVTRPERVAWPRSGEEERSGVLHLLVRPAAVLDVQHAHAQIVERVNTMLGWRAIRALKLRQTPFGWVSPPGASRGRPLPPEQVRALEDSLSGIAEPGLRASLYSLGLAALRPPAQR